MAQISHPQVRRWDIADLMTEALFKTEHVGE